MSRMALWEEIRRLIAEGTPVMLTTQYLEEADQLADRIAIIDHGRIVREGEPATLKAAIGEPTRFTGVGIEPGAVTPFRPAFMPGEVVSVGRGGWLVLAFDEPILDDPRHPFGVDLIVYGNAFCADLAYPGGIAGFSYGEGGINDAHVSS